MSTDAFNASVQREIERLIALGVEQYEREQREAYDTQDDECPNCGRSLTDCCGNCIFDDGRSYGFGESYGERNV